MYLGQVMALIWQKALGAPIKGCSYPYREIDRHW
jgi:hypothetical protein